MPVCTEAKYTTVGARATDAAPPSGGPLVPAPGERLAPFTGDHVRPTYAGYVQPVDGDEIDPDEMTAEELRAARENMPLSEAIREGKVVPTKWPLRRIGVSSTHMFRVVFTVEASRLKDLLRYDVGTDPIVVNVPIDALAGHLGRDLDEGLYHFVPHEILLDSYDNRGVPIPWDVQLHTETTDGENKEWLFADTMDTKTGRTGSGTSVPLRMESNCRATPGSPLFVADSDALTTTWRRWAGLDKASVMKELSSHDIGSRNMYYTFDLPSEESVVSEHPVVHAALRNMPRLVEQAQGFNMPDYSLESAVTDPNADTGIRQLVLPVTPVNLMVDSIVKGIGANATMMDLRSMQLKLRPSHGYSALAKWIGRREEMPDIVKNPDVNVNVCLRFVGVFVENENRWGTR